jgi:sugar lactone lactonase YvrE
MTSTAPSFKLEMAFLTGATLNSAFTLDDSVKGVLADGTGTPANVLLAPSYIDISSRVSGSVMVNRGRSRELDSFNAGTATFSLRNEDRAFDPLNTTSAYYPGIVPRTLVRITLAGQVVFVGRVEDYRIKYDITGTSTVEVSCVDGMGLLASMFLVGVTVDEEFPETRIPAVFNNTQISYPDPVSIVGLAQIPHPHGKSRAAGIAITSTGRWIVTFPDDKTVYSFNSSAGTLLPFTGLDTPVGVAVDSSNAVYVTDVVNNNVKKLVGSTQTTLGFGTLSGPSGIDVTTNGDVYVANTYAGNVKKLSGGTVSTIGGLTFPTDVAVDSKGGIYVADNNQIKKYSGAGTSWNTVPISNLVNPGKITIGSDDVLYVSDSGSNRVIRWSTTGTGNAAFSNLSNPQGVATDAVKNIYVVDADNFRVCQTSVNVRLLAAQSLADVSALEHLQKVEKAEYGWMYVDRNGTLIIRTRPDLKGTPTITFADDGSGIYYESIQMLSATQLLYNQVVASGTAGAGGGQTGKRVVANDQNSQDTYLVRSYDMSGTALANDADAQDLANYILSLYKDPEVRFDVMTVNLQRTNSSNQSVLAALDLGAIVQVVLHPPTSTDAKKANRVDLTSPGISLAQVVESINWTIDSVASTYKATYTFGSVGI